MTNKYRRIFLLILYKERLDINTTHTISKRTSFIQFELEMNFKIYGQNIDNLRQRRNIFTNTLHLLKAITFINKMREKHI